MNEVIEEKIKPVFAKVRNFLHENFLQHLLVQKFEIVVVNRYSRGLETCPQANLAKSGRKYFLLFFPTRPSDEYDSAPSRKNSRPLLDVFAYIG